MAILPVIYVVRKQNLAAETVSVLSYTHICVQYDVSLYLADILSSAQIPTPA